MKNFNIKSKREFKYKVIINLWLKIIKIKNILTVMMET